MGSVPPTLIGRRTRGDDQRGPMLAPLVARAASRWSGQTGRKTRPCYPSIAAQPVATAPPRRRLRHVGRDRGDRERTPVLDIRVRRSLPTPTAAHEPGPPRCDVGSSASERVLFF